MSGWDGRTGKKKFKSPERVRESSKKWSTDTKSAGAWRF